MMILTAKTGNNSDLFPDILQLYANDKDSIADVTFGSGIFWKNVDTDKYYLFPTDIENGVDMRNLPYNSESIDIVVIDPPYICNPKRTVKKSISSSYNVNKTDGLKTNEDVLELYCSALLEAKRVLKINGYCFVKCQDVIQSGIQRWNHISIFDFALNNGYYAKDLFILCQKSIPASRWKHQLHARKNHSYFWIFQKKG